MNSNKLHCRLVEFTNAHKKGLNSFAERTYLRYKGRYPDDGAIKFKNNILDTSLDTPLYDSMLYDSLEVLSTINFDDEAVVRTALNELYRDAPNMPTDTMVRKILNKSRTEEDLRLYFNRIY